MTESWNEKSGFISQDVESGQSKSINVWSAMSLIVGFIVGIGLFTNGSKILDMVGSPGMAMVMWGFGAIIAFCGGLSYIEWGLMIPESGGDAPYLEAVYTKPKYFLSFLYCWCRVLLVHPSYTAVLAILCTKYLINAFPLPDMSPFMHEIAFKALSLIIILTTYLICAFSNRVATKVTTLVTGIKLLVVVFMIISGIVLAAGGFPSINRPQYPQGIFHNTSTNPAHYASALFMVAFAYDGWSMLASSLGELSKPEINIPRSMIGGLSLVSIVYLGLNTCYFLALSVNEITQADVGLGSMFASRLYGDTVGLKVMGVLIAFSAYGACLAVTFAASRVVQAAGERNFLPYAHHLGSLHPSFNTPFNALSFHSLLSCALILIPTGQNTVYFLIDAVGFPVWVLYTINMVGLLYLRYKQPNRPRLFKVWIICPVIIIITGIFASIFPFFGDMAIAACVGLGCMVLSIPSYYLIVYKNLNSSKHT